MKLRPLFALASAVAVSLLTGCIHHKPYDYSALKASNPLSILVLPPINESPDVKASYSVWSQVTYPLAEAGYYVMPVALVDETFKHNGLTNPVDIQETSPKKLHDIFGADAAMYITVTQYGTKYMLIDSNTIVSATARLVDLKTGTTLWSGMATASSNEGNNNNNGGGLIGVLITAAVKQIVNSATDAAYPIAGRTSVRLLSASGYSSLLYGPRSPKYGKDRVK